MYACEKPKLLRKSQSNDKKKHSRSGSRRDSAGCFALALDGTVCCKARKRKREGKSPVRIQPRRNTFTCEMLTTIITFIW